MPNWLVFTFAGVSAVSFRLAPVRALSLCWVKTSTWPITGNTDASTIMVAMKWRQGRVEKARHALFINLDPFEYALLEICAAGLKTTCTDRTANPRCARHDQFSGSCKRGCVNERAREPSMQSLAR